MAKKEKEVIPKKSLDYIRIVDEMSEESFDFCVSNLYPLFDYHVMKKEEVRRVDLKEKLVDLENQIPSSIKEKCPGILNYYFWTLKLYFDQILKCKAESRAEKYKIRAYEAMNKAMAEKGTIEDVDDAFLAFIMLLRVFNDSLSDIKNHVAVKPTFMVIKEDAILLKFIYDTKDIIPEGLVNKKGLITMKKCESDYEVKTAEKIMYINNVIFLARSLQHFGGYQGDE